VDHPGVWLVSSDEGFRIVDEVGSENIRLLFDIYHQQISEGDIERRIRNNIGAIGHFHCAGIWGRHELEAGELNYPWLFGVIGDIGYTGALGLEYFPLEDPLAGLGRIFRSGFGPRKDPGGA
jgi:hydroxypyruvate isomerase